MVAIGGGSQSHNLNDEEARMRKLVKDRKSASRRKSKSGRRLQTSLETFDEVDPCDVDDDDDEEEEASQKVFGRSASWASKGGLTLGRLLSLQPGDAFKTLAKFGDALRDNFGELHAQAKNEATWLSKKWKKGTLYHDALVRMVNALENRRMLEERRFSVLNQVYDKAKSNPTETELNNAIDHFDEVVETFTTDRENIANFERMKVDVSDLKRDRFEETRRSDAEKESRAAAERRSLVFEQIYERGERRESNVSTSESEEDGAGDGNAAFAENSETDFEDEFGTVPTMSPLLQTVSGQVVPSKLTKRASRIHSHREHLSEETVGHAVGHGGTVTDVSRDLSSLAKQLMTDESKNEKSSLRKNSNDALAAAFSGQKLSLSKRDLMSEPVVNLAEDMSDLRDSLREAPGRQLYDLTNRELRSTIVRLTRRLIWMTFEHAHSSTFAYVLSVFYIFLIFASSFAFCLETLPEYQDDAYAQDVFYGIEVFCVVMFTIEYVLRSLCCPVWRKFVIKPLNLIDLAAILPFYLELALPLSVSSLQVLRTIRLVRVIRILRLGAKFGRLSIISSSIAECTDMLVVSVAIGSVCTVVYSTLIYYAEHGDWIASEGFYSRKSDVVCEMLQPNVSSVYQSDGSLISGCSYVKSPYSSIPASFWWCVVTLMTVGYGDNVPVTPWGKFVAFLTMITSVLLLALPISVIGTEFTRQWLDFKVEIESRKERTLVAPRCRAMFKALKHQKRIAQEAQQDVRFRALNLDDHIQTIKTLVQRRNTETAFLYRKIASCSGVFSRAHADKILSSLVMDDLDNEMHEMFISHRDYKATAREMRTIWSGSKMLKFTEFLISVEHVLDGLCNEDLDLVSQEIDTLFFEVWRVRATLSSAYSTKQTKQAAPDGAREDEEKTPSTPTEKKRGEEK
jgi:hypothetical protein